MLSPSTAVNRPVLSLTVIFCAWKLLLLLVVGLASGPSYDTSSQLAGDAPSHSVLTRLITWDAVFFTSIAQRGYKYEQEWAFGYGHTHFIGALTRFFCHFANVAEPSVQAEALTAVVVSHLAHYGSVLCLWMLSLRILHPSSKSAFLAALLHIVTPAGIFLSAPYAESLFSLLAFAAILLFTEGSRSRTWSGHALIILSGVLLGISCTVRSNGLFYGLLFLPSIGMLKSASEAPVRLLATVCGGGLLGLGALLPQAIAYYQFCYASPMHGEAAWCSRRIPSIYTYVQETYWEVGLFRYWRAANIPLFFISFPLLTVLILSGFHAIQVSGRTRYEAGNNEVRGLVQRLGIIQLVLALLAIAMYHIQIVMRIASGYPVWYWWLAQKLEEKAGVQHRKRDLGIWASRTIVAYAIIQAGLFATFLPPA